MLRCTRLAAPPGGVDVGARVRLVSRPVPETGRAGALFEVDPDA